MKTLVRLAVLASLATALAASLPAQTTPTPGVGHYAAVNERGDHVMGFDHDKTTHHFRLTKSGGVIEVAACAARAGSDHLKPCGARPRVVPQTGKVHGQSLCPVSRG